MLQERRGTSLFFLFRKLSSLHNLRYINLHVSRGTYCLVVIDVTVKTINGTTDNLIVCTDCLL